MTLAQIMAAHGKALGPLGVAVYAWIDANPGSTYREVADGLDMGESTVRKCVRQFEALGIAHRRNDETPNGLQLSARVYPGTIERGVSDNPVTTEPGQDITPLPQNPVTIERPENTGVSLSDPGTIERGTSGTKVAPSKAIRTSTDKNFNNGNNARAAPPVFTHAVSPAIQVYRDVFGTDPPPYGQDQIEGAVKDLPIWRETCEQWQGNNNDRTKIWNMLDAYRKKVKANANGDGRERQGRRGDGARDKLPQPNTAVNREWSVKNRV